MRLPFLQDLEEYFHEMIQKYWVLWRFYYHLQVTINDIQCDVKWTLTNTQKEATSKMSPNSIIHVRAFWRVTCLKIHFEGNYCLQIPCIVGTYLSNYMAVCTTQLDVNTLCYVWYHRIFLYLPQNFHWVLEQPSLLSHPWRWNLPRWLHKIGTCSSESAGHLDPLTVVVPSSD